jgi:hypothetical protein
MAFKKKSKPRPKLAADPKVQAVKAAVAPLVKDVHAPDGTYVGTIREDVAPLSRAKSRGPSKTQVCDAVREGQPGLAFAAVDRIATAVMRLYGRE